MSLITRLLERSTERLGPYRDDPRAEHPPAFPASSEDWYQGVERAVLGERHSSTHDVRDVDGER
jgi:hypothetical protein